VRGYDSFLITTNLGANRKIRRLSPAERWCAVHGVWAIAAESPVRGYLWIAQGQPAVEKDYAELAGVTVAVAKSTVRKMRELGMLERDEEGVEYVHDWHDHQRPPKPSDAPEATRERQRRSRLSRKSHSDVTRDTVPGHADVTISPPYPPLKGKGREDPPSPPKGGRERDRDIWKRELAAWVAEHPVTDELLAVWEPVRAQLRERVDGTGMIHLGALHPHSSGDTLILGGPSVTATWVPQRFGSLLAECASCPVQIIACDCDQYERAA
jgi:hypothetical protein